jgi:hypothetical protein
MLNIYAYKLGWQSHQVEQVDCDVKTSCSSSSSSAKFQETRGDAR